MTSDAALLTTRALTPVISALELRLDDIAPLLAECGIERSVLENPEGRVARSSMVRLWQGAARMTHDPNLGFHLALDAPVRSFEVIAYAFLASPSLREAYRRASRYQGLIHQANTLEFREDEDGGTLEHHVPGGGSVSRHPAEFLAATWLRLGRLLTGDSWFPTSVWFAHAAPDDVTEHHRFFGNRVRFASGRTAMVMTDSVLDARNPRADSGLAGVLDRYAETMLERRSTRQHFGDRVHAWAVAELARGEPTVAAAARALDVSQRTLHRNLRAEGTTFREVLDRLRHSRAISLLTETSCSISEVAFLLGFSELSSFYRAFRRWTGKTPASYRERGA